VCGVGIAAIFITQPENFRCRGRHGRQPAQQDALDRFIALLLAFFPGDGFIEQLGDDGALVPVGEHPVEALLDVVGDAEVHGGHDALRLLRSSTIRVALAEADGKRGAHCSHHARGCDHQ